MANRTEKLIAELEIEKPEEDMVSMIDDGLKQAEKYLEEILLILLTIAT